MHLLDMKCLGADEVRTRYKKQCELEMKATGIIKLFSDVKICFFIEINFKWNATRYGTFAWLRDILKISCRKISCDRPVTWLCFFGLLVWQRVYFFASLGRARVRFLAILVKEKSNFVNSCVEAQNCGDFGLEKPKIWQSLSTKRQLIALLM